MANGRRRSKASSDSLDRGPTPTRRLTAFACIAKPPAPTPTLSSDGKPSKPDASFPLFAHASGQWAKKDQGQALLFRHVADPDAALRKYFAERDDLTAAAVARRLKE